MTVQEQLLQHIDTEYSYQLAKRMEQYQSNEALGYRSAGSVAEYQTGEMLKEEMLALGLSDVTKDAVTVDGWEFKKAVLSYHNSEGIKQSIQLGAYQTQLVTDGPKEFSLIYLHKGTAKEYENKDVTGKLVLVEVNQRDEWWINYPVYQAHLRGAAALIAIQSGGYGEIDEEALNAQDIAGPEDAPAFSISRKDAAGLLSLLSEQEEIQVWFDADTRIKRDVTTYNITGCIPGVHKDRIVMMSAHYDSYFDGFQDDNTAVAMMFGIAKAYLTCGYKPQNTILLCAMAAEEWGVADSNFDWSTGAYEQVFTVHPEWAGKVIADLNFELPALAHGTRARIRSCYEYIRFINDFLSELPSLTPAYPEEARVVAPIETWSDDFSIAISGIPSMVNDFTGGSFMETHYHSQFDNDTFYDEQVYRLHHELFALLIFALDQTAVVPLCFSHVFKSFSDLLDENHSFLEEALQQKLEKLENLFHQARSEERMQYEQVQKINARYQTLLQQAELEQPATGSLEGTVCSTVSTSETLATIYASSRTLEQKLLCKFKLEQDRFVRIDWYGNVFYPHEIFLKELRLIDGTIRNLKNGDLSAALRKLYRMDNNAYAFSFDEKVYDHFNDYLYKQPKNRLKWGYGRLLEHQNMFQLVKTLLAKKERRDTDYQEEIRELQRIFSLQSSLFEKTLDEMCQVVEKEFLQDGK